MVSTNRKNLQIIEYCFKLTENRFSLAGMENMFKRIREKTALAGISEKSKKVVANSSDKCFKWAFIIKKIGFHLQEKK